MRGMFRAIQPPAQNAAPDAWPARNGSGSTYPSQIFVEHHAGFRNGILPKSKLSQAETKMGPLSQAAVTLLTSIFLRA